MGVWSSRVIGVVLCLLGIATIGGAAEKIHAQLFHWKFRDQFDQQLFVCTVILAPSVQGW